MKNMYHFCRLLFHEPKMIKEESAGLFLEEAKKDLKMFSGKIFILIPMKSYLKAHFLKFFRRSFMMFLKKMLKQLQNC